MTLEVKSLSKTYKGNPILKDVSFTLQTGEFAFLTGRSGSGKTTLLKTLYRDLPYDNGTIQIDGQNIEEWPLYKVRRKMGVIFQTYELLEQKTVLDNVLLAGFVLGKRKKELEEEARHWLSRVGLSEKEYEFPHELSGGQQQRVAIARALLMKPSLLIADEPTGNLDPDTAKEVMDVLYEVNQQEHMTMLIVTHATDLIPYYPSKQLNVLNGKVIQ